MSEPHDRESWLDRNGLVLVILYGLVFVTILITWHPQL